MGLDTPEITVLISTYNDRSFVQKKLGEIQGQTAFERAEFIFIESASPGKERELLQPFCLDHDNCNLITLDERVGLYRAWNIGWETSAAPLVCISNMDDAMHPRLLECVLDEIPKSNFDLLSVLIAKQGIDSSWNSFAPTRLKPLALSTRPGPFFVWRRDLKNDFGMFDERLALVGDKDFWARAVQYKLKVRLISSILYLYTKHPHQLSRRKGFKAKKAADQELCKQKGYPHVWPSELQNKVRRVRRLSRIPVLGDYLLRIIDHGI